MKSALWGTILSSLWLAAFAMPAAADSLRGAWRGSGTVTFSNGSQERATCRANFKPSGQGAYDATASCSSQTGTVTQEAFVRGRGNRYRGTFYNPEFDTTGNIQLNLSGGSMVARLTSNRGTAVIRLSRAR